MEDGTSVNEPQMEENIKKEEMNEEAVRANSRIVKAEENAIKLQSKGERNMERNEKRGR